VKYQKIGRNIGRIIGFFFGITTVFTLSPLHAETVKLVTFDYPPFVSKTKIERLGNGLLLDTVEVAIKRAGLQSNVTFQPQKRAQISFMKQRYPFYVGGRGGLTSAGLKPEEFESIVFGFYYGYFFYLKSHHDKAITFGKLEDLSRYKVGVLRGSVLMPVFQQAGVDVDEADRPEYDLIKLERKRIDLWVTLDLTAKLLVMQYFPESANDLTQIDKPIIQDELVLSYLKTDPSARKTAQKIAASFQTMKVDGTYMKILTQYWGDTVPKNVLPQDMQ
jgi:ABC-type amino acid transport substrate-binding protein